MKTGRTMTGSFSRFTRDKARSTKTSTGKSVKNRNLRVKRGGVIRSDMAKIRKMDMRQNGMDAPASTNTWVSETG